MANFRLFAATGNGKQKFVSLVSKRSKVIDVCCFSKSAHLCLFLIKDFYLRTEYPTCSCPGSPPGDSAPPPSPCLSCVITNLDNLSAVYYYKFI